MRITLECNDKVRDKLEEISQETGMKYAALFSMGLALMDWAFRMRAGGYKVFIEKPGHPPEQVDLTFHRSAGRIERTDEQTGPYPWAFVAALAVLALMVVGVLWILKS